MRVALAAFAAIIFLAGGETRAEPLVQTVEEHRNDLGEIEKRQSDFLHRASGFAFPGQLAEMPARKTYTYGPGDAEVYYTLYGGGKGDAWISLYVYPALGELLEHEKVVATPIIQRAKAVRTEPPAELPLGPDGAVDGWYNATVEGLDILTGYRLVHSGNWFIKARISIPVGGGDAAMKRAMDALAAIPWIQSRPEAESTANYASPATPRE